MMFLPFALILLCGGAALAADAIPATATFPVLPFDAPAEAAPQLVPVAANHAMEGAHPGITRAILVIPDDSRDANGALAPVAALAGAANASTMILAPQFLLPSDIAAFAAHLADKGRAFPTWDIHAWPKGDDSMPSPGHRGISSFTVADLLLIYLADRARFPDLKTIAVAGFGAGGAFAQRYAAFGVAAPVLAQQRISLRYVVADAPSFLYLTATRPLGGRKGFGAPDTAACPDFNAYPYGLDKLNPYARRGGINQAKTGYVMQPVTYLNATAPDAATDTNCAALAQGSNAASRALNYQAYLQSLYGEAAAQNQIFALAKDAKNDAAGLFGSACGMAALFGDGNCSPLFGSAP